MQSPGYNGVRPLPNCPVLQTKVEQPSLVSWSSENYMLYFKNTMRMSLFLYFSPQGGHVIRFALVDALKCLVIIIQSPKAFH